MIRRIIQFFLDLFSALFGGKSKSKPQEMVRPPTVEDAPPAPTLEPIPEPEPEFVDRSVEEEETSEMMDGSDDDEQKKTIVKIFYGTDRKPTNHKKERKLYGSERNINAERMPMEYGTCEISIPPKHKAGEIESPKWWKFEFKPNTEKHVVLLDISPNTKDAFFQEMNDTIQAAKRKEAFVFVHGYNVSFDEAAKRTAQIAFDLPFDGAPILYSWPSNGKTLSYSGDEANIQWTQPHLQQFLTEIAEKSGAETIHLIAHSMGNRALTRAFAELSEEQEAALSEKFKRVILTAPDIDADVFKDQIAPAMIKSKAHITLYTASNDVALGASKAVHGNHRAGKRLLIMEGIETIDATAANSGLLKHSYFAESIEVITDIYQILNEGERAEMREGLIKKSTEIGVYWEVQEREKEKKKDEEEES